MKTVREIHTELVLDLEISSQEAADLLGRLVGRTGWAVFKWMQKAPPDYALMGINQVYESFVVSDEYREIESRKAEK